jgi:hypothetical protein
MRCSEEVANRLICPRCGEAFPYRGAYDEAVDPTNGTRSREEETTTSPPGDGLSAAPATPPRPQRLSNRAVAALVLAGMALMALFGLIYALATESIRRGHDRGKPPPEPITVPLVARMALAVYLVSLVYAVVRALSRRGKGPVTDEPQSRSWRHSVVAFGAVGLALLALVILTSRKERARTAGEVDTPSVQTVAPAALPSLAYLPDDVQVAAGIHLAEMLGDGAPRPLVDELLLVADLLGLGHVEKWTGLKLEDLDHVVVGWHATGNHLKATVVVRARKPYSTSAVAAALHTARTAEINGKPVFSFVWTKSQQGLCWCPSSHTLVFVLALEASQGSILKAMPPRAGENRVPASLRPLFGERPMPSGTPLWIAGQPNGTEAFNRWLALTPLTADSRAHAAAIHDFDIGVRLDSKVTITAFVHATQGASHIDAIKKGARELERFLDKQEGVKMEMRDSGRSSQDGSMTIQVTISPEGIKQLLFGKKRKK